MTSHTVGQVMTSDVVQARRATSFKDLVRLLDRHHISGLPVVDDDDKVIGVVSGTDLVRAQARRSGKNPDGALTAHDLMTTPAVTVHPEQTVPEAARLMERRGVERLPVVDEEDRLIGIATRRDLLRVFLRTDDDIGRQVTEEVLVGRLGLRPDAVTVRVRDGVVTLDGRVQQRSQVAEAVHLAWRLEGVVGVVNALAFSVDDCAPPVPADTHPSHLGAR
ncbi:CBS domain-containing protein [Streptomyces sp. SAI-208]|jgi:CBS domain-containing protein|uniref:CBS domain-containing protein n=1 Tax=unclassified Streptomyces TaxID=2593676 RepID=UPI002473014F|nr:MULTISPECIES: CBS domain-containing protein [unclassified Streptomyces]MDH6514143.1 CBS domain-containing protein [Streptomyces sp. SAI-090]MDH6565419.1 CBS domain-containing protein [Streptomyces sp. SAI-117]MDH6589665.1 CBS domain-containing protein [Streptomyces sp. SAI-133]MDH6604981.1 CBS domain-containing protein [Streptomyces sp. SAI-208]MDH6621777.1 CBS domain-containing protein [Streptomyces sp. SAI-135]